MARKNEGTTRRGFLGRLGAAAVLPLVPGVATAPERWPNAAGALLGAIRTAYMAEVARFAETLRPRFESGELHAYREEDDAAHYREVRAGRKPLSASYEPPSFIVEALAAEHFGIVLTERPAGDGDVWIVGDYERAHLILAASPHSDVTGDGECHPCDHAREAIGWDVIVLARERGWYTPTPDEGSSPLETRRAELGDVA